MEKEFVTYEQAVALKELGFDERCIGRYCIVTEWEEPTGEILLQFIDCELSEKILVKAPLKQQVFRWFREKYNYDISVRGASFRANWVIGVPLLINNDSKDGYSLVISWDYKTSDGMKVLTYEEAENACIDKLIELIKNK